MVRLSKSQQPQSVTIASEQDYRKGEVITAIADDCYHKCYICEDKSTTINVEHIIPHCSDPALKYDWNNLFIACGHCNSIKHTKYDDILNPIKCDPEEHIALSIKTTDNLINQVRIETLTEDDSTKQTAELLGLVYNGGSTNIKEIECSNLRNEHLIPTVRRFKQYINDYHKEPDIGYDKLIIKEINRSSAFAAFKRKIIRDDPKLSITFADYLSCNE